MNIAVRVNSPGADGDVSQSNHAAANAAAGVDDGAAGAGTATATADQPSPSNVNVSVRIASPGSSGAVTQTNTASADAADAPTAGARPAARRAGRRLERVEHRSVGQRMLDCLHDDEHRLDRTLRSRPPLASPSSSLPPAGSQTATAAQTNPTNVNISVRVGSPGHDDVPTQMNTVDANAASASATVSGASNVNVSVVLPGAGVVVPTGNDPWVWNWVWTLGTVPTPADAPTGSDTWLWSWVATQAAAAATGASSTPAVSVAPVAGHWIWTWTWTGSNGVTSSFSFDQACSCSWVWSWTWSGDPLPAPSSVADASTSAPDAAAMPTADAAAAQDTPDITQTNAAAATAIAIASLALAQDAGSAAGEDVTQVVASSQRAEATAQAKQTRPTNVNIVTAGVLDGLSQENAAEATAGATVDLAISQTAIRSSDDAAASAPASSTQTIASTQIATADAQAVQVDAANVNTIASLAPSTAEIAQVEQQNLVAANAFGGSTGNVDQHVSQSQAGDGPQDAAASQVSTSAQAATASAQASQTDVGNVNDVMIPELALSNPALAQSNSLTVGVAATNTSATRQTTTQASANSDETVLLSLEVDQQADVKQSGDAGAGQAQADRLNVAHWNGLVATPEPPADELPAAVPPTDVRVAVPPADSDVVEARRTTDVLGLAGPTLERATPRVRVTTRHGRQTPVLQAPAGATSTAASPSFGGLAAATYLSWLAPARAEQRSTRTYTAAGTSNDRSLVCPTCGSSSLFGAIEGAHTTGSAGVVAALSRFRLFAPSGAGRVRHDAPALGLPVEIAALERPG